MNNNPKNIQLRSGVEKHLNGSFTMYGEICGETFKQTYHYYTMEEARRLFKAAIMKQSEQYFVNQ